MTTNRDHIISLARECSKPNTVDCYHNDYFTLDLDELTAFYLAAQREAYEKAAHVCLSANEYGFHKTCNECAEAILKLKDES